MKNKTRKRKRKERKRKDEANERGRNQAKVMRSGSVE